MLLFLPPIHFFIIYVTAAVIVGQKKKREIFNDKDLHSYRFNLDIQILYLECGKLVQIFLWKSWFNRSIFLFL